MSGKLSIRWPGQGLELFEHTERISAFLTRGLMIGAFGIALVTLIDLFNDPSVQSAYGPVAATGVAVWCWVKLRMGRPDAVPVLNGVVILTVGFPILALASGATEDLSNSATIVIITAVGILALNLPGYRQRLLIVFYLVAVGVTVFLVQMGLDPRPIQVLSDVLASVLAVAIAFFLVSSARRALEVARQRYQGVLDTAPAAVAELDLSQVSSLSPDADPDEVLSAVRVLTSNRIVSTYVMGRGSAGKRFVFPDDIIGYESRQRLAETVRRMAVEHQGEETLPLTIGDSPLFQQVQWTTQETGNVTAVAIDVTARIEAQEALTEQIQSRDRFIAAVSHELRTPLTAVLGLLEEVKDETRPLGDAERAELLRVVVDQARDVSDIVQDLLVAARAESGSLTVEREVVDLVPIARQVTEDLPGFVVESPDDLEATADALRVRQVLRNLTSNAIRHGGERRRLVAGRRNEEVVIEVRDSGEPMSPEQQSRIFEPYYRAYQAVGTPDSVGIGLSVSRQLARLMDGDVVYSHDGEEAVFTLTLPAA